MTGVWRLDGRSPRSRDAGDEVALVFAPDAGTRRRRSPSEQIAP